MALGYPAERIQWEQSAPRQMAAMLRLEGSLELDETLANLIKLRASQINGCGFCIDMHWKDARASVALGEEAPQAVFTAVSINAWNRLLVSARVEPGPYRVGDAAAA